MNKSEFFDEIKRCHSAIIDVWDKAHDGEWWIIVEMKSVWYKEHLLQGQEYSSELKPESMDSSYAKTLANWFIKQLFKKEQHRSNFGVTKSWLMNE